MEQKLIDRIIPEPFGGAHKDHQEAARIVKAVIKEELSNLIKIKPEKLIDGRLEKFGKMGSFIE